MIRREDNKGGEGTRRHVEPSSQCIASRSHGSFALLSRLCCFVIFFILFMVFFYSLFGVLQPFLFLVGYRLPAQL
jgi:hypothetical protein